MFIFVHCFTIILSFSAFYGHISCIHCQILYDLQIKIELNWFLNLPFCDVMYMQGWSDIPFILGMFRPSEQFQSAFTHESDDEIPSKGTSPFTPMGEITVDPNEVLKLLNNLKIHKAPGPDGLSARVLKECSSEISPILVLIYNETLAQGTVLDDWRQANVAPIFKKGEKYDAANYRPVSLTCICCKTLEHIIVSNINKHLAFESILADCQHGFRSQRSCETQLV